MKGLVSIITPCYNTGAYVGTLLETVLNQSYPHIEMIAIDDGSTDNTAEIIKRYIPKFKEKGYSLTYLHQENSGQSVAIQKGLELITGEYLVWPDSDDHYASDFAIEKMVDRLKSLPEEFAMVRTQEIVIDDSPLKNKLFIKGIDGRNLEEKDLFEDCLFQSNNFYYCSGAYLFKTENFFNSTELPIFTSKDAGQNWQLLLPVLYHFRCSTILEPLYNVVRRETSHSRNKKNYVQTKKRLLTYRDTIIETLNRIKGMPEEERVELTTRIENKYNKLIFDNAIIFKEKEESNIYLKKLKEANIDRLIDNLGTWMVKKDFNLLWRIINGLNSRLKRLI